MHGTHRLAGRALGHSGKIRGGQDGSRAQILDTDMTRPLVLVIHKARQPGRLRARRRCRIRLELERKAFLQTFHVAAFEVSRSPEHMEPTGRGMEHV